jgi:hypothetical protein
MTIRELFLGIPLIALLAGASGCAVAAVESYGDDEPIESKSAPIWNGQTTVVNSNVVRYKALRLDGRTAECTAMVLNQDWLVTAAHCLDDVLAADDRAQTILTSLRVQWTNPTTGLLECVSPGESNAQGECTRSTSAHFVQHPSWDKNVGCKDCEQRDDDIALIRVFGRLNRPIIPLGLLVETPATGTRFRGVGYGFNSMSTDTGYGVKRFGNFDLDIVRSERVVSRADDDYRFCGGDSGGAWLFNTGSGYLLFGVHTSSEKNPADARCASGTGAAQVGSRVSPKVPWIRSVTGFACPESFLAGHKYALCST